MKIYLFWDCKTGHKKVGKFLKGKQVKRKAIEHKKRP